MKRRIKAVLGRLIYATGVYKHLWRNRAVIVLFHRIDDRYVEAPLTCSERTFSEFCRFFSRYFTVVSLGELLRMLDRGDDVTRHLAITFDDGYRDNYRTAAIELRKNRLPACFFVVSGFMGTDMVAWWDAEQSIRSEWMSWDEVRALAEQGFEIGAHTMTHADCGVITGEDADREIGGSRRALEAELGREVRHFAYPYGDPQQMSEENRMRVRDAGFDCCLSAHGGGVAPTDDKFRLHRTPIDSWYKSPYQFGYEVLRRLHGEAPA